MWSLKEGLKVVVAVVVEMAALPAARGPPPRQHLNFHQLNLRLRRHPLKPPSLKPPSLHH